MRSTDGMVAAASGSGCSTFCIVAALRGTCSVFFCLLWALGFVQTPRSKSNWSQMADSTSLRRAPVKISKRKALAVFWCGCCCRALESRESSSIDNHRSLFPSRKRSTSRAGLWSHHRCFIAIENILLISASNCP